MTFLATLGKYVQDSLSTITPAKIFNSIGNIYNNYKRARSIWCLSCCLLVGSSVGVLFILQPQTLSYFQPIVLKALPFAGDVGSRIGVFVIGSWIGGALGHNAAKYTAQQFALKAYGHSNTAYIIRDVDVARIISANPQIYGAERDVEANIHIGNQNAELKTLLISFRNKIISHKNEPSSAHDIYKHALLAALRTSDLGPIYDLLRMNEAKREARDEFAQVTANYLAPRVFDSANSSAESSELRLERLDVSRSVLDENRDAYKHFKRRVNGLMGRFYDLTGDTANNGSDRLTVAEKRELLTKLNNLRRAQRQKTEEERARVPLEIRRIRQLPH